MNKTEKNAEFTVDEEYLRQKEVCGYIFWYLCRFWWFSSLKMILHRLWMDRCGCVQHQTRLNTLSTNALIIIIYTYFIVQASLFVDFCNFGKEKESVDFWWIRLNVHTKKKWWEKISSCKVNKNVCMFNLSPWWSFYYYFFSISSLYHANRVC